MMFFVIVQIPILRCDFLLTRIYLYLHVYLTFSDLEDYFLYPHPQSNSLCSSHSSVLIVFMYVSLSMEYIFNISINNDIRYTERVNYLWSFSFYYLIISLIDIIVFELL